MALSEALALQVSPGKRAHRDHKDLKEQPDFQDLKDLRGTMDNKVLRALPEIRDRQDSQVKILATSRKRVETKLISKQMNIFA